MCNYVCMYYVDIGGSTSSLEIQTFDAGIVIQAFNVIQSRADRLEKLYMYTVYLCIVMIFGTHKLGHVFATLVISVLDLVGFKFRRMSQRNCPQDSGEKNKFQPSTHMNSRVVFVWTHGFWTGWSRKTFGITPMASEFVKTCWTCLEVSQNQKNLWPAWPSNVSNRKLHSTYPANHSNISFWNIKLSAKTSTCLATNKQLVSDIKDILLLWNLIWQLFSSAAFNGNERLPKGVAGTSESSFSLPQQFHAAAKKDCGGRWGTKQQNIHTGGIFHVNPCWESKRI